MNRDTGNINDESAIHLEEARLNEDSDTEAQTPPTRLLPPGMKKRGQSS